jgi:hypothetical protein
VAIWHDPLEELIAGLERALPAETWSGIVPYEVFCLSTDVLLYGNPEEQRAFEMSPEGQRVAAYFARIARQRDATLTK